MSGSTLVLSSAAAQSAQNEPVRRSRFGPPWPDDRTPVKINAPHEYDPLLSFEPSADKPSRGTFFVDYPAMRPWPFGLKPRCKSMCEGQMALEVTTGAESTMNRAAWSFLRDLQPGSQQGGAGQGSKYAITPVAPPPDYTQAWQKTDRQPSDAFPLPIETTIYLRAAADGTPLEFAECATVMPKFQGEPVCQIYTTLDGMPAVQIGLRFQALHWSDRNAMRAAAMRLVKSWL